MAGKLCVSPLILGNLWDVTDKDIDRYLKAMLDLFLQHRKEKTQPNGILETAALAREACKLGFLIGAAPVCYGLPVYKK